MFECTLDSEHPFEHHGVMSRTRVRRRRLVAVAAIVVAVALGGPAVANAFGGPGIGAERRVVVRSGDTLWDLATRLEPGSDPRGVVARIVEANSLPGASIAPGQVLVIPGG
jgi:nucleoid-associated protein YgaU